MRSRQKLPCYDANANGGNTLTIEQAAELLGISASTVRQLIIQWKVLPATQIVAYAPWRIERDSLELTAVKQEVERIKKRVQSAMREMGETPSLFSIT